MYSVQCTGCLTCNVYTVTRYVVVSGTWYVKKSLASRELIRLPVFGLPETRIFGDYGCPNVSVARVFFLSIAISTYTTYVTILCFVYLVRSIESYFAEYVR